MIVEDTSMLQGKIVMIEDRGFGFISGEWQDVYFDRSAVESDDFRRLSMDAVVEYELAKGADSCCGVPQARWVRLKTEQTQEQRR